jgi:predicted RNase H-like nuclease
MTHKSESLCVGFDSAWTAGNSGGIVGAVRTSDGNYVEIGLPKVVSFLQAEEMICAWQEKWHPKRTLVLIDQPTIVPNATGQRPVENIVASLVSRLRGGMQPANTTRVGMFCPNAPIWPFLRKFGGAANPRDPIRGTAVYETYPVLAMIALGWTIQNADESYRLAKYNPARRKTFSLEDWRHVSKLTEDALTHYGLLGIAGWIHEIGEKPAPRKADQDCLDACVCLLVALHAAQEGKCLKIGDLRTGYIFVPYSTALHAEMDVRCNVTGRLATDWVTIFQVPFETSLGCDWSGVMHSDERT